jgi:RNA-directed DNA polymerase
LQTNTQYVSVHRLSLSTDNGTTCWLYREDVLRHAYECCRANHGASGVDGVRFEDIEASGVEPWFSARAKTLKERTYQPDAIRRVYIPKPNGKLRPLGIPPIQDRVAQTAMVLVLGPIFEADLPPQQYAYRPDRNAHDVIRQVHSLLNTGHTQVVDAHLAAYFDASRRSLMLRRVRAIRGRSGGADRRRQTS